MRLEFDFCGKFCLFVVKPAANRSRRNQDRIPDEDEDSTVEEALSTHTATVGTPFIATSGPQVDVGSVRRR
jgi:hypothetical protein